MLHVWSQSTGTSQIAPLIFLGCPLGITAMFANTIRRAITICPSFFKTFKFSWYFINIQIVYSCLTWTFPWIAFEWHVLHIFIFPSNDICTFKRCWKGYLFEISCKTDFFKSILLNTQHIWYGLSLIFFWNVSVHESTLLLLLPQYLCFCFWSNSSFFGASIVLYFSVCLFHRSCFFAASIVLYFSAFIW